MSKIEWTDRSDWNPVRGCTRCSEGCRNCYAEILAARFSEPGQWGHGFAHVTGGDHRWTGRVELQEDRLTLPLKWRKPARIFPNSTFDLFHESLPDSAIDKIFAVMALTPRHTYQPLTKRAARMRDYLSALTVKRLRDAVTPGEWPITKHHADAWLDPHASPEQRVLYRARQVTLPLPNVWLGVSVENQQAADERIPHLLETPAAKRFISAEPLLGPMVLEPWLYRDATPPLSAPNSFRPIPPLDWVIVGGESGPDARECDVGCVRSIVAQCKAAGVACFIKQLGASPFSTIKVPPFTQWCLDDGPSAYEAGPFYALLKDRKGADMAEWPEDLRVREFPA